MKDTTAPLYLHTLEETSVNACSALSVFLCKKRSVLEIHGRVNVCVCVYVLCVCVLCVCLLCVCVCVCNSDMLNVCVLGR